MFGNLNIFAEEDPDRNRREFFWLTKELEQNVASWKSDGLINCEEFVDNAKKIRNLLARNKIRLNRSDKIRLLKTLNKAKIRALMAGTTESYRAFQRLDSIGGDVLHHL